MAKSVEDFGTTPGGVFGTGTTGDQRAAPAAPKPFQITLAVPADRIINMMISAIDSGDPVTSAHKGGWCAGIGYVGKFKETTENWYADPAFYARSFKLEIIEVDDETTGHQTKHYVTRADMVRGLGIMAQKFPHIFRQIIEDDTDAPCADIFLQCILFGEEKYA
jgi:hypothetical protein